MVLLMNILAEEFKNKILENDIDKNIIFLGIFGSTARETSLDIKTKDVSVKSDIDILIVLNRVNRDLIKKIYIIQNSFEDVDITLYVLDVINNGIKSNYLLGILFLNLFEKSKVLYETYEFESLKKELSAIATKNKDFDEKYKGLGKSYAMVKDIMASIIKNTLLESFSSDI